jgi:hypothetical protein
LQCTVSALHRRTVCEREFTSYLAAIYCTTVCQVQAFRLRRRDVEPEGAQHE